MKLKTQKQVEAEIKRRNRIFAKATAAQQRVLIAKDVIERVEAGQFFATPGSYVNGEIRNQSAGSSVQNALLSGVKCNVCAKGAALLSCTAFKNRQSVDDLSRENYSVCRFSNGLQEHFNRGTLNRMESCFEGWNTYAWFFDQHPNDTDRLIAIMRNIVKNKGTFNP